MARKLTRSRDVVFLENKIIGDAEKSNESQSSPKIHISPTSISPLIVHDDHRGAREDNDESLVELVDQALLEPPTPIVEPDLRRSTRE